MSCKVLFLDCRTEKSEILKWATIARAQYTNEKNFQDIFPWEKTCETPYIHFIAHAMRGKDPLICGWLSLRVSPKPKHGTITELSTRRIKDAHYGGVGQLLNNAVLQWAIKERLQFLQLWPLNDVVRAIYQKPEWGYMALRSDVKYLFRVLSKAPSESYLDTLVDDITTEIDELEQALIEFAEDYADLEPLVEQALEYIVVDNAALEDFKNTAFIILGAEEDEFDKEAEMETLLYEFIEASTKSQNNIRMKNT